MFKSREIINPGNIFSEKLQFPSFFTPQKILMIHDSFWDARVSFCCKEDILESDTILMAKQEMINLKILWMIWCVALSKTALNRVNKDVKGLGYAPSCENICVDFCRSSAAIIFS